MLIVGQTILQNTEKKSDCRQRGLTSRHWSIIIVSVLAGACLAAADSGYLPRVGPAPLRFRAPALPATNHFIPATPPAEVVNAPDLLGPFPNFTPPIPDPPVITNEATSASLDPAPSEAPHAEDVVSPQMLLRYFNKSTNGVSSSVTAPIDFTPPKSAEQPSSTATYSTGQ